MSTRLHPWSKRHLVAIGAGILAVSILTACAGSGDAPAPEDEGATEEAQIRDQVTLGVGEITPVWDTFERVAQEDHGIDVELVTFADWVLPNQALVNDEIDVNAFQHVLFLSEFNHAHNETLRPVGVTSLGTLGVFSDQHESLDDLPDGARILVPNDPTNQGRALLLLERIGLIELDPDAGLFATADDISENPRNIEIVPLVAQQIPQSIPDADAGIAYQVTAVKAGVDVDSALASDLELVHEPEFLPYQAVFAAREADADDPTWAVLEEIYHSPDVVAAYDEENQGLGVLSQASLEDLLEVQQDVEAALAEGD